MIHIQIRHKVSVGRLECDVCHILSPIIRLKRVAYDLVLLSRPIREECIDRGWCAIRGCLSGTSFPIDLCPDCIREEIVRRREEAR